MNRRAIAAAFASQPWAIMPDALQRLMAAWDDDRDPFTDADPDEVEAMYVARGAATPRTGAVAVVPVLGTISKRDSLLTLLFGGTSTTRLSAQLRSLAADDSVATILLNIDSPGGVSSGLPELAAEIRRTAETKHVVAIANDLAASAAYWIASQADEIVATPESVVGSIGAYIMHADFSRALDAEGITVTYVQAGDRKTDGNPYEPLSDRARDEIQAIVDTTFGLFVGDIAKGRSAATKTTVTPATVRSPEWGEGAVLTAKAAKAAGLVDRVETYSQAVARLSGVKSAAPRTIALIADAIVSGQMDGHVCTDECDATQAMHTMQPGEEMPEVPASAYAEDSTPLPAAEDRLRLDVDAWLFGS